MSPGRDPGVGRRAVVVAQSAARLAGVRRAARHVLSVTPEGMSAHVTVDDLAIVDLCLEREKRIRSRWQCIHIDAPDEEERKARVMRQPTAPWDSNTRIVPVRKFSRGEVNRNKMSKSLLHSRKSQMLADNEQWQARMRRLDRQVRRSGSQGNSMQDSVMENDASYADWIEYEGQRVSRTWRQMQRSMPELSVVPLPAAFVASAPGSHAMSAAGKDESLAAGKRGGHREDAQKKSVDESLLASRVVQKVIETLDERRYDRGQKQGRKGTEVRVGERDRTMARAAGRTQQRNGGRTTNLAVRSAGTGLSRENLSNLHSICKEALRRDKGKVSVSFAMENSSASSSDSELGSRRGSRRASMDVALRLVDFAQSVVQESREPQGSRSRSGDSNQASALDRFDSPSACCEDSHGNAESSRPSRLRPHALVVEHSGNELKERWRMRLGTSENDVEDVSPSLEWFRNRRRSRRQGEQQRKDDVCEDPLAVRARTSPVGLLGHHRTAEEEAGRGKRRDAGSIDRGYLEGGDGGSSGSPLTFSSSSQPSDSENSGVRRGLGVEREESPVAEITITDKSTEAKSLARGSAPKGSGTHRAFFSWQRSTPQRTSPSRSSHSPRMTSPKSSHSPSQRSPASPGLLSCQLRNTPGHQLSQVQSVSPTSPLRSSGSYSCSPFSGDASDVSRDWDTHVSCVSPQLDDLIEPKEAEGAGVEKNLQGTEVTTNEVESPPRPRDLASEGRWQQTSSGETWMDARRSPSPSSSRRPINDLLSPRISLSLSEARAVRAIASPGAGGVGRSAGPRSWARSPSPHKESNGRQARLVATPPTAPPPGHNFRTRTSTLASSGTATGNRTDVWKD